YFMLDQARTGLYPQLERPWEVVGTAPDLRFHPTAARTRRPWSPLSKRSEVQHQMSKDTSLLSEEEKGRLADQQVEAREPEGSSYGQASGGVLGGVETSNAPQRPPQYDPNAAIQTGPGLPRWQWTTLSLAWHGPVERHQHVRFVFLSPWVTRFLAFL